MKITTIAVIVVLGLFLEATLQGQDGLTEEAMARQAGQRLVDAGYEYKSDSLVSALRDPNPDIASTAAALLSRFRPTPSVVEALQLTAHEPNERVALSAFGSLMVLKASGWQEAAIARLPQIQFRLVQIALAGILARGGRGEGWPVITAALLQGDLAGVAAQNAVHFLGVKDVDGRPIDVLMELEGARKRHAGRITPGSQRSIDSALKQSRPAADAR